MKKVYQRIKDPRKGDCFKCTICSLLELDYNDVPNFIDFGDLWFDKACELFKQHGYELGNPFLYNPNVVFLENPTENVYRNFDFEREQRFLLTSIKPEDGIDGLFLASVYSPKYTDPNEHPISHLHSVICDINFNIVFDPNPDYQNVLNYPYSRLIGYNGIRGVDTIHKFNIS